MILRRLLIVLVIVSSAALAQEAVPTPQEHLARQGFRFGEDFTPYDRILDYFQTLTKTSPLITMEQFGTTYEGRPLVLATLASPKNRAALDTIKRDVGSLSNPVGLDANRAANIAKNSPAIVWLAFGVHGNESSSAEAAMLVAASLLREPALLENLVILIDPLQNPDGRERYISWFRRTRGTNANANPDAMEHYEPWPGGRFNHYLIDMNRDWTWMSQRETQARVAKYREWNPQVFVDFHEMGYQSSYFFPPDAKPINANLPRDIEKWLETFGRANADVFSKRGWPFFIAERFDLFYPGYGDAWPSLHGAIGMTYEMAGHGRAGVAITREDGTVLTLSDRIQRHFTTGMTTVRTAAENREQLLLYTYNAMRTQMESGKSTFLIVPGSPNFDALIDLLQKQAIEVQMLTAPLTMRATRIDGELAESRSFPAGTAVVSTKQPLGGLAQTLLEKSAAFTKGFLEEQRQKAQSDEPDDFYDLTTWSLPLAMNVETFVAAAPVTAQLRPFEKRSPAAFRPASYGYLVDALEPNVYRFAGRLLTNQVRFSVIDSDVPVADRTFARGTIVILKGNNREDLDVTLSRIARDVAVSIHPVDSGWLGAGLGSEKVRYIKDPKIALVGGAGVYPTSYGMLWHTLDVDTPIPHTTLALESVRGLDLDKYEVLVLPDGDYADRLGKRGIEKLKAWIEGGGTLIAIKGASAFLREKDVEISKLKPWEPPKKKDEDKNTQDERYHDFRVPGSAFRSVISQRSYLTFGVPRPPALLIEGSAAFTPVSHAVDNIVTIAKDDDALISGVAWPESLERVRGSAYLVSEPHGRGHVITFADEPHFRLFWRGTLPLFLNAVLYSPSFPR